MAYPAQKVLVSKRQRAILEKLARSRKTPQRTLERASIVLMSCDDVGNREQARKLGVDRQRVRRWRQRWVERWPVLEAAEREDIRYKDLRIKVLEALSDNYRSGGPPKFTAEQMTQIVALACEKPEDSGLPFSTWTPPELAREAIRRGIVESISPRHLDRFLKGGGCSPSQEPLLAQPQGG